MSISFDRRVTKRKTGLRVSWYYSPPQTIRAEGRFVEDNKLYIFLANLVHQHGVTAQMKRQIKDIIREGFQIKIDGKGAKLYTKSVRKKFNCILKRENLLIF